MAVLLKGYKLIKQIEGDLIKRVEVLTNLSIEPKLAIVRIGANKDDLSYERSILRRFSDTGITIKVNKVSDNVTTEDLINLIMNLNADIEIHGILMFRPLPNQIDEEKVISAISPQKDVDCCTPINLYKVFAGENSGFLPCTPEAVVLLLDYYNCPIEGSKITLIGRSMVVGRPLSMLLLKRNATVKICHTRTKEIRKEANNADILIAAVGRAEMIDDSYVTNNMIVIDVGINVNDEGKIVGDVDIEKVEPIVKSISPVPKGIGGVTTAILAEHVVKAAEKVVSMLNN